MTDEGHTSEEETEFDVPEEGVSVGEPGARSARSGFSPFEGEQRSVMQIVDALLKRPGTLAHELRHGNAERMLLRLVFMSVACLAAYGLVMGMFSGGRQLLDVPAKVAGGTLFSALICLPSLYIFLCLGGSKMSLFETAGVMAMATSLLAILLLGFAPIAWVFTQSTSSSTFMGAMHLVFWLLALGQGLAVMRRASTLLNDRAPHLMRSWTLIFVAVLLQMSTTLRPVLGPADSEQVWEKRFFLTHWMSELSARGDDAAGVR